MVLQATFQGNVRQRGLRGRSAPQRRNAPPCPHRPHCGHGHPCPAMHAPIVGAPLVGARNVPQHMSMQSLLHIARHCCITPHCSPSPRIASHCRALLCNDHRYRCLTMYSNAGTHKGCPDDQYSAMGTNGDIAPLSAMPRIARHACIACHAHIACIAIHPGNACNDRRGIPCGCRQRNPWMRSAGSADNAGQCGHGRTWPGNDRRGDHEGRTQRNMDAQCGQCGALQGSVGHGGHGGYPWWVPLRSWFGADRHGSAMRLAPRASRLPHLVTT